jgi:hypothetical protein
MEISQQLDREPLAPLNDEAGRADLRRAVSTPLKAHNVLQPGPIDRSGLTSRPTRSEDGSGGCKEAPTASTGQCAGTSFQVSHAMGPAGGGASLGRDTGISPPRVTRKSRPLWTK